MRAPARNCASKGAGCLHPTHNVSGQQCELCCVCGGTKKYPNETTTARSKVSDVTDSNLHCFMDLLQGHGVSVLARSGGLMRGVHSPATHRFASSLCVAMPCWLAKDAAGTLSRFPPLFRFLSPGHTTCTLGGVRVCASSTGQKQGARAQSWPHAAAASTRTSK